MSEWAPQVIRIEKVEKHPDADNLDIATVLGDYPVICKRGEYKAGDLAGYIPVDTVVPDIEQWHFLSPKIYEQYEENGEVKKRVIGVKYLVGSVPERSRVISAKRLRGIYSMGLLVPLTQFHNVGDSLVEELGLKKREEEEEDNTTEAKRVGANAEKAPSGWSIPYYDIEGARKFLACLRNDEEIVLSEKIHGANFSAVYQDDRLWCKSRNHYKRLNPDDPWWDFALRHDLENKLRQFSGHVFFGELYGNVKGFRYDTQIEGGRLLTRVRFFDVFALDTKRYLDYDQRVKMIEQAGLDAVPEMYRGVWTNKDEMYSYAEGVSTLNPKHIREGWVLNTAVERFEPRLNSRMQVKLIGQAYSLAK